MTQQSKAAIILSAVGAVVLCNLSGCKPQSASEDNAQLQSEENTAKLQSELAALKQEVANAKEKWLSQCASADTDGSSVEKTLNEFDETMSKWEPAWKEVVEKFAKYFGCLARCEEDFGV